MTIFNPTTMQLSWTQWLFCSFLCIIIFRVPSGASVSQNIFTGYNKQEDDTRWRQSKQPLPAAPETLSTPARPNIVLLAKVVTWWNTKFRITDSRNIRKPIVMPAEKVPLMLRVDAGRNVICWLQDFKYQRYTLNWYYSAKISCLSESHAVGTFYFPLSFEYSDAKDIDFQLNAKEALIYWRSKLFCEVWELNMITNVLSKIINVTCTSSGFNPIFAVDTESKLVFFESTPGNVSGVPIEGERGNYSQNLTESSPQVRAIALDKPRKILYFWYEGRIRVASYTMAIVGKFCEEFLSHSSVHTDRFPLEYHNNFLYWLDGYSRIQAFDLWTRELLQHRLWNDSTDPFVFAMFEKTFSCVQDTEVRIDENKGRHGLEQSHEERGGSSEHNYISSKFRNDAKKRRHISAERTPCRLNDFCSPHQCLDTAGGSKDKEVLCSCPEGMLLDNRNCIPIRVVVPAYDSHEHVTQFQVHNLYKVLNKYGNTPEMSGRQIPKQPKWIVENEISKQLCWIDPQNSTASCMDAMVQEEVKVQIQVSANATLLILDHSGSSLFWNNGTAGCIFMHLFANNFTYGFPCFDTRSFAVGVLDPERKVFLWADTSGGLFVNHLGNKVQAKLYTSTYTNMSISSMALDIYHGKVYFIVQDTLWCSSYDESQDSTITPIFIQTDTEFKKFQNLLYFDQYLIGSYFWNYGIVAISFNLRTSVISSSNVIETHANYESSSILLHDRTNNLWNNPCVSSPCAGICLPNVRLPDAPKRIQPLFTCIPFKKPDRGPNPNITEFNEKDQLKPSDPATINSSYLTPRDLSSETIQYLIVSIIFLLIVPVSLLLILVHTGRTLKFQKLIADFTTMNTIAFNTATTAMERIFVSPVESVICPSLIRIHHGKPLSSTYPHIVFEATCNGRAATAKTIKPTFNLNNLMIFLQDIRILDYVNHSPNILAFFGIESSHINRGMLYAIQEHSTIGTLQSYLRSRTPTVSIPPGPSVKLSTTAMTLLSDSTSTLISPNLLLSWCKQIAAAMEYLSFKGILHTDLRTENVMVFDRGLIKVANFTLSKRKYTYSDFKKYGRGKIPWQWMAYESLLSFSFTHKSDVWSYAITLWEIFSLGQIPYQGYSWKEEGKFVRRLNSGLRPEKPGNIPEYIYSNVMEPSWMLDPERRPTFSQILNLLSAVQKMPHPQPSAQSLHDS